MNNKNQTSFFIVIFCSFLIIIIIFSLFYLNVYQLFTSSLNNEIIRHNSSELQNLANRFGTTISDASDKVMSAYFGEELLDLRLGKPYTAYDTYSITKCLSKFVYPNNNYIFDLFLYSTNSDIVITSNGSFIKKQFLESSYYCSEYGVKFWDALSKSKSFFDLLPAKSFTLNDLPNNSDMLLLPIAFKAKSSSEFILVALMDVRRLLTDLGVDKSSLLYLYNGDTLLFQNTQKPFLSDIILPKDAHYQKHGNTFYFKEFINVGSSSQNQFPDLHFIRASSYNELADSLQKQQNKYWIVILLAVSVSLIISIILSSTISSPIKKILNSLSRNVLPGRRSSIRELNMIGQLTGQLISDNSNYRTLLNKKNTLLRNYFYHVRLKNLHISTDDGEEIKAFFPEQGRFQLVYFVFHYTPKLYDDMDGNVSQATFALSEYLQQLFEQRYPDTATMQVEDTQIISILTISDNEDIGGYMNELLLTMENENEYVYTTAVAGTPFTNIGQLNTAYDELHNLMKYEQMDKRTQFITKSNLVRAADIFYFTPEQEQALLNFLSKGNVKDALSVLHQILSQNSRRNVSLYYFRNLTEQIARDCLKTLVDRNLQLPENIEIAKLARRLESSYKLEDFTRIATEYVETVCTVIEQEKNGNDSMVSYVCDYMNNHFSEDIYLDMMSRQLGITSNYLSHYFKEKTGRNFSDYLTNIRMEKAKEMLLKTDMHVDEIAAAVCGYCHTNSFIRMFKKTTGQTPGEFRKLRQG